MIQRAKRIAAIPPYLFAEIDKLKAAARARGVDVIDLGIGDPDKPTPEHVVEALAAAARDPATHRYPPYEGLSELKQAIARWYDERYGVKLDPENEVLVLIGSKEGIAHVFWAFVDPGDVTLVPDPAYPVYRTGTLLAGGRPYTMPLTPERGFLPDLTAVEPEVAEQAKLLFLNYPNNPTAAVAPPEFFAEVVDFARRHNIIVCHDFAYCETTFDGYRAPSFLATPGAKEVGIEFNSLSKPYNMTGWRVGFAVGNKEVLAALSIIKTNVDSGVFDAVQLAARAALTGPQDIIERMNKIYTGRRNVIIQGLNSLGWRLEPTKATFYVWAPVPAGYTSKEFAALLLEQAGVNVAPGNGYGEQGEGFFRIALTVDEDRLAEAVKRLRQAGITFAGKR
ncbi:LL-diaminopimelate aminotransferase [Gelria sp. Kuro-4]|nr:LL-diaminopimelate aminotransferase [Gelria sp. Kuro-4]BCV24736.1 LL-diaminopimelate aminotransferase [Gelria sp. Kuro-4]